jgi:hypothetical protein
MRRDSALSLVRIMGIGVLILFGTSGLLISSFHCLEAILFPSAADPSRIVRVLFGLVGSILLIVMAELLLRVHDWCGPFFTDLPRYVVGVASAGVLAHVYVAYSDRHPHFLTRYEIAWSAVCVVGYLIGLHLWTLRGKRRTQKT